MILSQTPLRVSLCSADYPDHYLEFGGAFVGFTVSQYIYVTVRKSPKHAGYHSRLVYSEMETVNDNSEIQHRAIRATLEHLNIKDGVECITFADINARSGLGSSAAFIVGLTKALSVLQGKELSYHPLAEAAIFIEASRMNVTTGIQDHVHSTYGGITYCKITKDNDFIRSPVLLKCDQEAYLKSYLLLFHTGISRSASDVAQTYVGRKENIEVNKELTHLSAEIFNTLKEVDIEKMAQYVEDGWQLKRKLSSSVSSNFLDDLHDTAILNGALAVRVCGAGGGGVVLVVAPPKSHGAIRKAFHNLAEIDFNIVHSGSRVILNTEEKRC